MTNFSCYIHSELQQEVTVTISFIKGIEAKRGKSNFMMQLFLFQVKHVIFVQEEMRQIKQTT